jgi:autophagy-related protein 18
VSGQLVHLFSLVEKRSLASISLPSISQTIACNSRRLLVALPEKLLTFALPSLQLLDELLTAASVTCICCAYINLSNTNTTPIGMAALGLSNGEVVLYNTLTLERGETIPAHKNAVTCVAFSPCGEFLATASVKGTVVKTLRFNVGLWRPMNVFRRGTQAAAIRYMTWYATDAGIGGAPGGSFMLACSGDSETIHVFQGSTSAGGVGSSMTALMPKMAKNFLEAQRAFAVVRLRCTGHENALILEEGILTVVSSAGYAFLYDVRAGECKLKREFSLRTP